MNKRLLLALMCCLTASAAAQQTITSVMILNANPELKAIYVTDNVQMREGEKVKMWCNATIKDKNGVLDLNGTRIILYNMEHSSADGDPSVLYNYRPIIKYIYGIDHITSNVSALFTLTDKAVGGRWACSVTTVDDDGASDGAQTKFGIYSKECANDVIDDGETYVDCGGKYCIPCIEMRAGLIEVRAGKEKTAQIDFISHAPERLYIESVTSGGGPEGINVDVKYTRDGIPPKGFVTSNARVSAKRDTSPVLHEKPVTVKTTSGVVNQKDLLVNVLPLPPLAMRMHLQSTCVNNPATIRVLDNDTGKTLGDVRVEVRHNEVNIFTYLTDSFGEVSFTPKDTGVYIVSASREGYPAESKILSIISCEEAVLLLTMAVKEGGYVGESLTVLVSDQDGNPVKADVHVTEPDGGKYTFSTDITGKTLLELNKAGEYRLKAEKAKYTPTEKKVTALPAEARKRGYLPYALVLAAALIAVAYKVYKNRQEEYEED